MPHGFFYLFILSSLFSYKHANINNYDHSSFVSLHPLFIFHKYVPCTSLQHSSSCQSCHTVSWLLLHSTFLTDLLKIRGVWEPTFHSIPILLPTKVKVFISITQSYFSSVTNSSSDSYTLTNITILALAFLSPQVSMKSHLNTYGAPLCSPAKPALHILFLSPLLTFPLSYAHFNIIYIWYYTYINYIRHIHTHQCCISPVSAQCQWYLCCFHDIYVHTAVVMLYSVKSVFSKMPKFSGVELAMIAIIFYEEEEVW